MKLCEDVKEVLDIAVPDWMERLCAVDFNIAKLDGAHQTMIQESPHMCFIGELHGKKSHYVTDGGSKCKTCDRLALIIPFVFGSTNHYYTNKLRLEEWTDDILVQHLSRNKKSKIKLLRIIAEHVKKEHKSLMNKPKIRNDC